ncbi:ABC transporter ATP-binding protein [Plantactinospora soyae]|uniref:ABC-2 type transport system ATP-binding protein n=1 Tax=Plantactinospora soyae TaxID=1544732 RepID=A0A927M6R0_9ACTN|nr:ATP-binding cassette domain-containing protein [Plantactinospora soyae]MBE1488022.1 ABC-2 type transport system ATP-binding protein [Plantactinospora soyae]
MTKAPPLPAPAAVLTAERLTKRFGRLTAVDDVSFDVRPGVVTGFLGPNGAGKTTMLAMLAGLVRPTSGRVLLGGTPLQERSPQARTIGVAIEACGAHPGRSARQHLRILAGFARLPRTRVEEVLALAGLTEVAGRRVGTFSLGMRQRLGLAAALLGDPEVLLLDEPANGLDPEGIRWLRTLLRERAERGRAVLVSSHLLSEAAHTVDDVVVVRQGRVVHAGPIADLTPSSGVWVRTDAPGRLTEAVVRAGGRITPDVTSGRYLIDGLDAPTVAEVTRRAQVDLHELTPQSTSLEDVFLDLIGARS